MANIKDNLNLAILNIKIWKHQYIKKQLIKNPDISKEELNDKIKKAKYQKFKNNNEILQLLKRD